MKNVIVYGVYVVGMHRWGPCELEVGTPFFCKREPDNPVDKNAMAVFSEASHERKLCYIRREDAASLVPVFNYKEGAFYLKAKDRPSKFGRRGPMQRCNVGFKVRDSNVDTVRGLLCMFQIKIF